MIKSVLYTLTLVAVFSPPIDIKHYIVQHTQSVSVPIRHPSDKESIFTSFETDIYIHRKYNKIPGTHAVYSCVWRLWVVFLEHGGGALGIFKSPVCTYNQAWTFLFPLYIFLPEQA